MRASFDVIVVGGGAAGVAAALRAHSAGATVGLVRAAPGATAVTSGGWTGPLDPILARALERAGLPYIAAPSALPHPFGDLRTFDFAAASHVAPHPIDSALLCGIAGLGGFAAPSLARMYATSLERPLTHIVASFPGTPATGWSPHSLAAALQREPSMLADAVSAAMRSDSRGASSTSAASSASSASVASGASVASVASGARDDVSHFTHVLMPAVLGLDDVAGVRAAFEERIGVPVFECLGAPPSIPGWRLDRALMRALQLAGVDVITGIVHGCDAEQQRIQRIHVSVAGSARVLNADNYVLATGKFLGGGIATLSISAREHALVETALGIPVWIDHLDQSFSTAESLTLTSRVRTYDQPLLRAGVHTNDAMRAVDARGLVLYNNLSVTGTVRADCDAQVGLGHAAGAAVS